MRALSRNTRRVTALTLAAALVIAVYLNWQYARTGTGIAADEEAQVVPAPNSLRPSGRNSRAAYW